MIMMTEIFIPLNVPSLKNGKTWTGRHLVKPKTVQNYLREHGIKNYSSGKKTIDEYKTRPNEFRKYAEQIKNILVDYEPPYKLEFYFIRKTRARFDFGNAVEILADLFTAHDVWEDDNCDNFLPYPLLKDGSVYHVDKLNPGVIIRVKR